VSKSFLVQAIAEHARKAGVSERVLLEHAFEREAIRIHDGGQSREEAERGAVDDILSIYQVKP
jgi:hypothetical protein